MTLRDKVIQPQWQRIILLCILGYEAAGCLVGGSLLIAAPDGHLMDMPVEMMHGAFAAFLIPGIILFGLGILNAFAFASVLRRDSFDWFLAGLALGGLFIWFWVEIAILREVHWLHAMWGLPVLLGCVVTIPLIALRHEFEWMQKVLLSCGLLSSLWYVVINIFVPLQDKGYSSFAQTVSELSAIEAPTRILWVLLALLYPLLFAAFGWGLLRNTDRKASFRMVGSLILVYSMLNFYWPPMHLRESIAVGMGSLTDTLHIVWAIMTILLMMLLMGFGAAAAGSRFRLYTLITFILFLVFGILTFLNTSNMEANLPTPWMGLWERINISAFMLWIIVFALVQLRSKNIPGLVKP